MRIAVNFTIAIPESSLSDLADLAAVDAGDRAGARRFVQAEAEQNLITYLTDNGVAVVPVRGVALPGEYPTAGAS